ncbi:MAG: glycosyltransferase [Bacteroidia bacterium]|nr:glycosyltransferase [Bacteroidia bacterium]
MIGFGTARHALEKQIRSLGLEDHIILAGKKPHKEIPLWINACDFFVLPSLNEGNPTVLFESLGCGKPFVGTKVGGVPEIITSEVYGLLVNPADPNDLKEKILMALDRTWDREAILAYAEQFTWENIAKKIQDVYTQVYAK